MASYIRQFNFIEFKAVGKHMTLTEVAIRGVLWKEGVLKNFVKFTGKHLCQSLFFNKVAAWGLQLY